LECAFKKRNKLTIRRLYFGQRLIVIGFNKFHLVILTWCGFNILACLSYCCFKFWAQTRTLLKPRTAKFWDKIWVTILIFYYGISLYGLQKTVNGLDFAAGSATVLFLEEVSSLKIGVSRLSSKPAMFFTLQQKLY
jgi:hypothetical protein